MKSFNDGLDRAIEIVLFLLMSGIVVFTFLGVLIRYVIRSTFGGCEEIILMQFCAVVFLGAAYGLRQKRHMAINFVYDLVPKKGRRIFDVINNLLILIFLIFLLIEGWRYTVFTKDNFTVFFRNKTKLFSECHPDCCWVDDLLLFNTAFEVPETSSTVERGRKLTWASPSS